MGNRVREGSGETRPRTELAWEDLGPPGARRADAGSGVAQSAGAPEIAPPPVRDPLPTRVWGLPPLPAEYAEVLGAGLAALAPYPLRLPEPVRAAIDDHVRLLLAWNDAINLSGIREAGPIAREHVLDSLTALGPLRRAGIDEVVDLGSGGGYPGLPLALALPARRALLVESIGKKARFLETAVAAVGAQGRIAVAATRAEAVAADPRHWGRWRAVVSRAMAELAELSELGLPLLARGGLLVAWKRLPVEEELAASGEAVARLGGHVRGCQAVAVPGLEDHVLVLVEKVGPTPPGFPRDPAARRRRPLRG
jgi:16S rRNA (guanine527-N7)-methyltransferase